MIIYKFFLNNSSPLPHKDITAFEGALTNGCFLLHKMLCVSKFIPLDSRNIQVFRKACAKFKYPAE